VYLGSTLILDSGSFSITGALTNVGWTLNGEFMVTATGASGTIEAQGDCFFQTGGTTGISPMTNTAAITIDWTAAQNLKATMQFGSASASNAATLRLIMLEQL